MSEPLSHIRRPNPPWNTAALTQCGKLEADFASVISVEEATALWKKHGAQRAAFLLCMTCTSTTNRHSFSYNDPRRGPTSWRTDPVAVMHRYLERVHWRSSGNERAVIEAELRALGALVEAHRDEFDAFIAGVADAGDLDARRKAKRRA